ncbi:amidohydrolase 3 [Streptomyces azureus]|uniref:Amidohydrolase 3 n=1 Tax=Streptomyces azureus TaxID=146537 RepID=A0A0K8PXR9_STRAJ|nr:amidohydrolase 3 [Streptomyces azureus]
MLHDGDTGLAALEGCTSHAALAAGGVRHGRAHRSRVPGRPDGTGADPVAAPADEVAEAPVRLTVTGGYVVYRGK